MTCEMLLEQAEEAMAQAKRWGRNQVRRADQLEQPDTTPSYQQLIAQTWHRDGHAAPDPRTTHALLMVIRRCRPDLAEHSTRVADLCVGLSTGILSPPDVAVLQTVALLHELDQLGTLAGTENATERVEAAAIRRATSPVNTRVAAPHNKQRYVDALGLVSPPVADEILFAAFGSPRMMAVLTAFRLPTFQHRGMLIPLGARILKLAHAFDELVYPPGGGGLDSLAALAELRAQADTKFEPALVERLAGYLKHFHTADRSPNGLGREPSTDMGSPTATQVAVAPTPAQ